jgi:hypothetical protein
MGVPGRSSGHTFPSQYGDLQLKHTLQQFTSATALMFFLASSVYAFKLFISKEACFSWYVFLHIMFCPPATCLLPPTSCLPSPAFYLHPTASAASCLLFMHPAFCYPPPGSFLVSPTSSLLPPSSCLKPLPPASFLLPPASCPLPPCS